MRWLVKNPQHQNKFGVGASNFMEEDKNPSNSSGQDNLEKAPSAAPSVAPSASEGQVPVPPNQPAQNPTLPLLIRIWNGLMYILFGLLLCSGGFLLLLMTGVDVSSKNVLETLPEISSTQINTDASLNGKLVSMTGVLSSDETIGDGLFLNPDKYIVVHRIVEMYSWGERTERENNNRDVYVTIKRWTDNPSPPEFFHNQGYVNPAKGLQDGGQKAKVVKLGVYDIDIENAIFPENYSGLNANSIIPLNYWNVKLSQGAVIAGKYYLFISKNPGSTYDNPEIGDLRIFYQVVKSGITVTAFGKLDGQSLLAYEDQSPHGYWSNKISYMYDFYLGTKSEVIKAMRTQDTIVLWLLRAGGLFLMLWGTSAIIGAVSTLISAWIILLISLILSVAAAVIPSVSHNIIVSAVAEVIIFAVIIIIVIIWEKKRK